MPKPIQLTPSEWAVMKQVWRLEPVAAPTVQQALAGEKGWTYSTVRTVMDRMVSKGFLQTEKVRNLSLFRSVIKERDAQKSEALTTLRIAFSGALTPFLQCLLDNHDLSAEELADLDRLIQSKKKKR